MKELQWHPFDPEVEAALPVHERKVFLRLLSAVLDEFPDSKEKIVLSLALGATGIAGQSLESLAKRANLSESALMKKAAKFCVEQEVMASPHLKHHWNEVRQRQLAGMQGACPPPAKGISSISGSTLVGRIPESIYAKYPKNHPEKDRQTA